MTAKLTRQQEIQNAQIAVGKGMRYILAQIKADSSADYFTEGPFPAHGGTWKTDAPSPGQQRLIAALREYDRDGNPLNIVVGADVSDGHGGVKRVTGADIPAVSDSLTGQNIRVQNRKTATWDESHVEYKAEAAAAAKVGKRNLEVDVERIKAEKANATAGIAVAEGTVAVGEAVVPVTAPVVDDSGNLPKKSKAEAKG